MLLPLFAASAAADVLFSDIGARHITATVTPDDEFTINITYYPFYIVFYDIPATVSYNEYYSRSPLRLSPSDYHASGDDLPVFRAIELPYGEIVFNASESSTIRFMYMSMPGLCQTGVFFSVASQDAVILRQTDREFFKLGNYDDKCFVVAAPTALTARIEYHADDADDTVFFYTGFYEHTSVAGSSINWTGTIGNATMPVVVRLVTDKETPPQFFSFSYEAQIPEKTGRATHIPRHREEPCEVVWTWYSEELIVTMFVASGFLVIVSVFLMCWRFQHTNY